MDRPSLLPDPDPEEASEVIHELEESRWYRPDREYEDMVFDSLYGLEIEPSGQWKYDHRLGTHSLLYDPEDESFEVRTNGPVDLLKGAVSRLHDTIRIQMTREQVNEQRFGYLLEDDAVEEYKAILEDDGLTPVDDDGTTVYQTDQGPTTIRVTERSFPEHEGVYADVEIEIPEGGEIPGGEFLLERQRSVSFDGELEARAYYVDTPSIYDDPPRQRQ